MKYKGLFLIIATVAMLQGCIYVSDSADDRPDRDFRRDSEPTVGQELLDLDRARAQGVISDAEYERAKQAILDDIN